MFKHYFYGLSFWNLSFFLAVFLSQNPIRRIVALRGVSISSGSNMSLLRILQLSGSQLCHLPSQRQSPLNGIEKELTKNLNDKINNQMK